MIRYIILIIEINAKWKDRVKYFSQIKKQRTQGQVLCLQKMKKNKIQKKLWITKKSEKPKSAE